jgi:heat shock protein HtpX
MRNEENGRGLQMSATLRTIGLFMLLIVLFSAIGYVIGGVFMDDWVMGAAIFLAIASVMNIISYFFSSKIVLWSYRAKILTEPQAPRLFKIVKNICMKSDMPMPRIAIVPTKTPNAFATGRNKKNAVVAATEGLVLLLNDDELEGVLAHEMAHVKNRDILVMSIAATIAGAISFAARMLWWNMFLGRSKGNGNIYLLLVVAITAPLAALLIQLAISRNREYKADRAGALMIQRPLALARALQKLEDANIRRPMQRGNPASGSLFIVNPFRGGGFFALFTTHPPMAKRIQKLQKLAEETGFIG